ncbi:MAG: sensor histidine kinase [Desulfonatronovibrio sp.]
MENEIPVVDVSPRCLDQSRSFYVQKRMHEKIDDYLEYDFSAIQSNALNVFFDLSQEFDSFDDLLSISVLIPKVFFDLECSLYLLQENRADKVGTCFEENPGSGNCEGKLIFASSPRVVDDCLYLPIKGNTELIDQLPFSSPKGLIGMLEVFPALNLSTHEKLFFEKYANRVGFQLHMRMISRKNQEHLQFIRTLVKDIGHNVIVPNMYFKLYYRRLEANIKALGDLKKEMAEALQPRPENDLKTPSSQVMAKMSYIHDGLKDQFGEILRHYEQTSLFLETLLRRSHFEQGKYVLERKVCNFKSQIIDPQIKRFAREFKEKGISIALAGVPDQEIEMAVDLGLISQVYANLFSNASKYTREVTDYAGNQTKFISYGWEHKSDCFGSGLHGVKLNVFSTGPHIAPEDQKNLFSEGFRAGNTEKEQGTGHGLFFIKEIVELHGGEVGYEPTPLGNNFFFILPVGDRL